MPTVPFFAQSGTFSQLWPITRQHVADVLDQGKFADGRKVLELEKALTAYTGAKFVVGVNSGVDALVLLLKAAGLRSGDEVVVPAFSPPESAAAVVLAGGRPVFADIEPEGYGIKAASVEAVAGERTRFVLPVHLFCRPADLGGVAEVAARLGLTVVEDAGWALGMRWGGRHAGLLGAGGALSFAPGRTLGALGDAGAVITNNPAVAEVVGALRHQRSGYPVVGAPSRMSDVQAAVLLAGIGRLDSDIRRRAALARQYHRRLADVPGVRVVADPPRKGGLRGVFARYVVEVADRDGLVAGLADAGVVARVCVPVPAHLRPAHAHPLHGPGAFPNAERASRRVVALPLYPDLTAAQVDRVCDVVAGWAA
ncbi:DegT/DnrJ/EryC1/StrS family aminotransferase [Actinosynnema sp. NPDC020468]|uniref:DegT/DnrJ/EryC1/StrS family aminotransferase n=1 Tax=Actinosynnema sp. NPDC020468 TaxID=3154488 RepID=UPI0033F22E2B